MGASAAALAEAQCRPEAPRTAAEAARRREAAEAALWEAAGSEDIEALCSAMVTAEQAGASEGMLAMARSMLVSLEGVAGRRRAVEAMPASPEAVVVKGFLHETMTGRKDLFEDVGGSVGCMGRRPAALETGAGTGDGEPRGRVAGLEAEGAAFGAPGTRFGAPGAGCEWRRPSLRLGLWTPRSGAAAAGLNCVF